MRITNLSKPQRIAGESVSFSESDPLYAVTGDLVAETGDATGDFYFPCALKLPVAAIVTPAASDTTAVVKDITLSAQDYEDEGGVTVEDKACILITVTNAGLAAGDTVKVLILGYK